MESIKYTILSKKFNNKILDNIYDDLLHDILDFYEDTHIIFILLYFYKINKMIMYYSINEDMLDRQALNHF